MICRSMDGLWTLEPDAKEVYDQLLDQPELTAKLPGLNHHPVDASDQFTGTIHLFDREHTRSYARSLPYH